MSVGVAHWLLEAKSALFENSHKPKGLLTGIHLVPGLAL